MHSSVHYNIMVALIIYVLCTGCISVQAMHLLLQLVFRNVGLEGPNSAKTREDVMHYVRSENCLIDSGAHVVLGIFFR